MHCLVFCQSVITYGSSQDSFDVLADMINAFEPDMEDVYEKQDSIAEALQVSCPKELGLAWWLGDVDMFFFM